ncbi:GNAT family N-acetyltransferase [Prauserella muralis]|uniref:GNAT family acetyltransferase n=1 Tax=Prauserella muralis TaxID=588067 RepID=A0A2V4APA2_9PSEU|nr:GNAT family N-acetyltransferase [Prauserella muralis]PXY22536.1 GNAT family acetyltransferase [Prauserella muralis]TWE28220.1 acetyltransferase (GNAT) family protein [Prauserella muralis]
MPVPSASRSPDLVRSLQERVARALPAEHVERVGDWWLRHTTTASWWLGTVLPHGRADPADLPRRIATAEAFYAGFGALARFQITPGACPDGLDPELAGRGYRRTGPMSLQTARTADVRTRPRPSGLRVEVSGTPAPAWFEAWQEVHGHGGDPRAERDLLSRVRLPSAFVCVLGGDTVIAVGRAVADDGWAGLFGMATLPPARGRGAGRAVVGVLADWAAGLGCRGLYLQVERDNDPALRLYARMGFTEACAYHYRALAG